MLNPATGAPQGLSVGLMLFNVFSNNVENGMKHTPSKYVHDTKMGEKAPGQAGEMIEQNIMKFNTRK